MHALSLTAFLFLVANPCLADRPAPPGVLPHTGNGPPSTQSSPVTNGPELLSFVEFCRDPVSAVCEDENHGAEGTPRQRDTVYTELSDSLGRRSRLPSWFTTDNHTNRIASLREATADQRTEIGEGIARLYEAAEQLGFGDVATRNADYKDAPFRENLEPLFTTAQEGTIDRVRTDAATKRLFESRLRGVRMLASSKDIRDFAKELRDKDATDSGSRYTRFLFNFSANCRPDGSYESSFVADSGGFKYVALCPAYLLRTLPLKNGRLDKSGFVKGFAMGTIGHEVGHLVGYTPITDWEKKPDFYKNFFDCLGAKARSAYGVAPDDVTRAARRDEITADMNMAWPLAKMMKQERFSTMQWKVARDALRIYCGHDAAAGYPSGAFRIRLIAFSKPVRDVVGCGPKKPTPAGTDEPVACGIDGEETL